MVSLDWQHGDYLGTIEEGASASWSAYNKDLYFRHGHGKYLLDANGIHFHLIHGGETFVPYAQIVGLELARRHASKYTVRDFITRVSWHNDGRLLISGFVFAKDDAQNAAIHAEIKRHLRH